AAADMRDEFQVCGRPLLPDKLFHLLHRLRKASVHAGLELVPQILNRIQIRTPWWPLDQSDSLLVEVGDRVGSGVEAHVVLLEEPRAIRVELLESEDECNGGGDIRKLRSPL